jgi:hypothetical protein
MPRNPRSPPYTSKYAISRSKEIEKFMVTVPRPVALSAWDSWSVKKMGENTFLWFPTEYDKILEHLFFKFNQVVEGQKDVNRGLFVVYNGTDIVDASSWSIESRLLEIQNIQKWKYDAQVPEYLVYIIHATNKTFPQEEVLRKVLEDAIVAILGNVVRQK